MFQRELDLDLIRMRGDPVLHSDRGTWVAKDKNRAFTVYKC